MEELWANWASVQKLALPSTAMPEEAHQLPLRSSTSLPASYT